MNSDPFSKHNLPKDSPAAAADLNLSAHSNPVQVPVFSCLIYIATDGGGVRARVANLAGLECAAGNERAALGKLVPAFKKAIAELLRSGAPIPWIEPPLPAEPGEQVRYIPVHL
jgi:hypothetical protein